MGTKVAPRTDTRSAPVEVARQLAPAMASRAEAYDREGAFPVEDFTAIRNAGLLGLFTPEPLGGYGATFADYAEVAMALAKGNGATALIFNMHACVTGSLALLPDELPRVLGLPESFFVTRDRLLADAARGALFAVAMSERGAGSRLSQLSTRYTRTSNGFRIIGSKTFCSGAGHVDGYVVAARSAQDSTKLSQFFVEAWRPGLEVEQTWDSLGMRATVSNDLHLDVEVPTQALLGGVEGLGLAIAYAMPQWLVASYAAVYAGVAQASVDAAAEFVRRRGLERLPAVRARIGRAEAAVASAIAVVREAARRVDSAPGDAETNRWVWRAKLVAGDTATDVAASMLEACGASATRRGTDVERLYRDARCGALQPATSDVCADWLGLAALGLDPMADAEVPRW